MCDKTTLQTKSNILESKYHCVILFIVISEGRDNFSVYIDLFKSATKKIEETYVTLQEKPLIQYHPVITGRQPPLNLL